MSLINCFSFAQFYSKNKGSIATTLLKPKPKQGAKSAEVQLSKSETKGQDFKCYSEDVVNRVPSLQMDGCWILKSFSWEKK